MAYAVNTSEALLELAVLVAVTLQLFMPAKTELKTCMADESAVLPAGTVVVYPPEMTFRPAGHAAVAVPVVCLMSVSGRPVMYCNPDSPGGPCGPCGPAGPAGPCGPCGP